MNEAVFSLPEGFVDRTLHRLESPLSGADPLTVEVRRLPLEQGQSLRKLVDGEVASLAAKVNGFTVLDEAEVALGEAPAILVRARFRARDMAFHQRQAHVAFEGTWILVVVAAPSADRVACDETFDRIVRNLEWRTA